MPHRLRTRPATALMAGALTLAVLSGCGQATAPPGAPAPAAATASAAASAPSAKTTERRFRALEKEFDARLGVHAVDTGTGREVAHGADRRFAYASTFKALLAGAVLRAYGMDGIDKVVTYTEADIVEYSPVTEDFTDTGMSLRELCAATLWYSDNTAANVLLRELGGPDALEKVLEELGDDVTEMDRIEPDLSEGKPGDVRDTSTPRALTAGLRAFLLGDALERRERELLRTWMATNTTGETLIAAGLPRDWTVADKSGTAGYGGRNDIAVVWPDDGGNPILFTVLSSRDEKDAERRDALIARAATVALEGLGRR